MVKKRGLISKVNFYNSHETFETVSDITEKINPTNIDPFNSNMQKEAQKNSPNFLKPEKSIKTQFYFSPGEIYESKMFLIKTIRPAKKSVSIIDKYLDYEVLEF
ncbi:hypothetical protein [Mesobacillus sp. MER 33]|uniref:hypothetical protein n=1 Tax=Mesobacillus sp. MER 33 TaxID=2939594 RepID=UPI002040FECB|nr:hypothetical protein [Mesobacillus sp. MER 33]MCM3235852.1 hypothetical protein [Mesobacillus sp. MER 48]